jgi:hypothetical protein
VNFKKLEITKKKFDVNLKFYFFLKHIVKTSLTDGQVGGVLKVCSLKSKFNTTVSRLIEYTDTNIKAGTRKQKILFEVLDEIDSALSLKLFTFSLKLYSIKDLLLQEAKVKNLLDISKLEGLDPLSLEYDKITLYSPYSTRVNGALLSLIFFDKLDNKETNFISADAHNYIKSLSSTAIELKSKGVEPNQIFMLLFNESINQSIISDSGSNYEDRIFSVLTSIGINKDQIKKTHDKDDSSTEFDFFFELKGKTFGIGAKRTLRERYKQFIKTAQMSNIDVMIEITLGIDLTEEKVKSIRKHDVFLFVADEIFNSYEYLRNTDGVYSSKNLTTKVLNLLV